VPIAASSVEAIERFVGSVAEKITARSGRVNALLIRPFERSREHPNVGLWLHPKAVEHRARLHPSQQVWVHVDYAGYRSAWRQFSMPNVTREEFLDHIQNREAVRLRAYSHPYLRLCPVSRVVNTSGGSDYGGEGMEKNFLRSLPTYSPGVVEALQLALSHPIQYADPMDLTKMLNVSPGTMTLPGVRDLQALFYPAL